jgi:hypothetical protein
MTEWSDDLAIKAIHYDTGRSEWSFDPASTKARAGWNVSGGRTIYSAKRLNEKEIICFEYPCTYVSCGRHRNRICTKCNAVGLKRAVVDENCPTLSFCSRECLKEAGDYIDACAKMLQAIDTLPSGSEQDQCRLVLNLLYARKFLNLNAFAEVLHMEKHSTVPASQTDHTASVFYNMAVLNCEDLLSHSDTEKLFCQLFRAVMYNSQSLPVPSLPGTSFLCLLCTLSKLNHSCDPNVQITFALGKGGLRTALVSTRKIERNEELLMTYISALHLRFNERRCILQEAFAFICACSRCQYESRSVHSFSVECDRSQIRIFRNLLPTTLTFQYVITAVSIVSQISGTTCSQNSLKNETVSLYGIYDILSSIMAALKDQRASISSNITSQESPRLILLLCQAIAAAMKSFSCNFTVERLQIIMFGIKIAGSLGVVLNSQNAMFDECRQYLLTEAENVIRFHELAADYQDDRNNLKSNEKDLRSIVAPLRDIFESFRSH